jgi:hypothetical protein
MTRCVLLVVLVLLAACSKRQRELPEEASVAAPVADPAEPTPASAQAALARTLTTADPRALAEPNTAVDCGPVCGATRKLGCKRADECESTCREMASVPTCQPELAAFFRCLSAQPVQNWECLEDGTGAIREGFCDAEQGRFAACLEKNDVH